MLGLANMGGTRGLGTQCEPALVTIASNLYISNLLEEEVTLFFLIGVGYHSELCIAKNIYKNINFYPNNISNQYAKQRK